MLTKIQKRGNNFVLQIPRTLAFDVQLEEGSIVEIGIIDGKIIITPVIAPNWNLEELLAGITKDNLHRELGTSISKGNEIW